MLLTWISASSPAGTDVRDAFTHSTVSLPFFHLHSQTDGQSFALDDFVLYGTKGLH